MAATDSTPATVRRKERSGRALSSGEGQGEERTSPEIGVRDPRVLGENGLEEVDGVEESSVC